MTTEKSADRRELAQRLEQTVPHWREAMTVHARMMFAGDDGSWAGETDEIKAMLYATTILANAINDALNTEREVIAALLETQYRDVVGQSCAKAVRMRKNA